MMSLTEQERREQLMALGLEPDGETLTVAPSPQQPAVVVSRETDGRPYGEEMGLRCWGTDPELIQRVNVFWLEGRVVPLEQISDEDLIRPDAHARFSLQRSWGTGTDTKARNVALNAKINQAKARAKRSRQS